MHAPFLTRVLFAALLSLTTAPLCADEEQDLIALLGSSAGVTQKCAACQRLRVIGTARSIPALAALLGEERTGHAARHALEGLPFPEADDAFRRALDRVPAPLKAGLADSLGRRQDTAAVPQLIPLLADADPVLAAACATALGRIGGPAAVAALRARHAAAPAAVRMVIADGLLRCADRLREAGDGTAALAIADDLDTPQSPDSIRTAAWRCRVLADPAGRPGLLAAALADTGRLHAAALRMVRELDDTAALDACLSRWDQLPEDAQLALLDAQVRLGPSSLTTVSRAAASSHPALRIAAWQALGELGTAASVPVLAQAAANGQPGERAAARDALARLRGDGVHDAILDLTDRAEPATQAELLRILGERGTPAAKVLLDHAAVGPEPVRVAALDALRQQALPDTLIPLLGLAAQAEAGAIREPALKALYALCQNSRDRDQTSLRVVAVLGGLPVAQRQHVLPVLAELATPAALDAALSAAQSADPDLAKPAVRVLAQWPNAAPASRLLEFARAAGDPTLRTLALRAGIDTAGLEPDPARRLMLLTQAINIAERPDEKKQALGQIGSVATPAALDVALAALADPAIVSEAGLAAIAVAEKLAPANPALAARAATEVAARCKLPEVVSRAWALRAKPAAPGHFIQDWLAAGPYTVAGAGGALAVFDPVFAPEQAGTAVQWKPVPHADMVDLLALFPNQANCAAYLRTRVVAAADTDAVLLVGSDDGIKAWLNGVVVLSRNVDRGAAPDQDMAPIRLKSGANDLLLKITQGGGGWAACARIVGVDGRPIPDLKIQPGS
jgi:HEAT repeat protein